MLADYVYDPTLDPTPVKLEPWQEFSASAVADVAERLGAKPSALTVYIPPQLEALSVWVLARHRCRVKVLPTEKFKTGRSWFVFDGETLLSVEVPWQG